jgi:hypothetical protein
MFRFEVTDPERNSISRETVPLKEEGDFITGVM